MELELRSFEGLEVRSEEGRPPMLCGLAAPYDTAAELWEDTWEEIAPNAFDTSGDILASYEHFGEQILGRTSATPPTLALRSIDAGLWCEITPPDSEWGRSIVEACRRGDVRHISAGWERDGVQCEWRSDGDHMIRRVTWAKLDHIAVTTRPIYRTTSLTVRSREQLAAEAERFLLEREGYSSARAARRLEVLRRRLAPGV